MRSLKNLTGGEGNSRVTDREGGLPKKIGLGQFSDLRGTWQERGSGVFEGMVDTPMHTMLTLSSIML